MAAVKKTTVSATEARVHFGEMMRRAEDGETVVVERSGQPKAIIMSVERYGQLMREAEGDEAEGIPEWKAKLSQAQKKASEELAGKKFDWVRIINDMREERSRELLQTFEAGRRSLAEDPDTPGNE